MDHTMDERQLRKLKVEVDKLIEAFKRLWNEVKNVFIRINQEIAIQKAEQVAVSIKSKPNTNQVLLLKELMGYFRELRRLENILHNTKKYRVRKKQLVRIQRLKNQALSKGLYIP